MKTEAIPFNAHVGLQGTRKQDCVLQLPGDSIYENHLGTVHASAQFTLAEAATGEFLLRSFPGLAGKTIPVVRDVNVKYKRPAMGALYAKVECEENSEQAVWERIQQKGLIRLELKVTLLDENDVVTMKGKIHWVIQKRPEGV